MGGEGEGEGKREGERKGEGEGEGSRVWEMGGGRERFYTGVG